VNKVLSNYQEQKETGLRYMGQADTLTEKAKRQKLIEHEK
jgi:hypothetical protein